MRENLRLTSMTESIKIRVRKGGDKIHDEKIVVYFVIERTTAIVCL